MGDKKLLPPVIEEILPAFYGESLIIPFLMNQSLGKNEIKSISIKIKSIYTNETLIVQEAEKVDLDLLIAYFKINADNLTIGNFYKVQIAYINNSDIIGYYSTVGVVKYTTKPKVTILNLKNENNNFIKKIVGVYSQEKTEEGTEGGDPQEKVYSYRFIIYDSTNQIYEDSGEILHNHENDGDIYSTTDEYIIQKEFQNNKKYYVQYQIKTINGLEEKSPKYWFLNNNTIINTELEGLDLNAGLNYENAYVNLTLEGKEKNLKGKFILARSDSKSQFLEWSELATLTFYGNQKSEFNFKDFAVCCGEVYKYSLQQYNDYNIYSDKIYSQEIEVYFEHIYLYDGERQLKIKYNPKVSSFKDSLLESKANALGSKFPFFFRNAQVGYKEIPISGLISYMSDEEQLFMKNKEININTIEGYSHHSSWAERLRNLKTIDKQKIRTTNLVDYNINAEKIFKLEVLNFLNDGKPKLFKSPTEGSYIVRLMNSSLSPNEQLGRMLHTFSSTATEIAELNNKNLFDLGLLKRISQKYDGIKQKTIKITKQNKEGMIVKEEVISFTCKDMLPGTLITIPGNGNVKIGITGSYEVTFDKPINNIRLTDATQGQIDILYYDTNISEFDRYKEIENADVPLAQIVGSVAAGEILNMFSNIEDSNKEKYELQEYIYLRFTKRPIEPLEKDNDNNITNPLNFNKLFLYYKSLKDRYKLSGVTAENYEPNKYYVYSETLDMFLLDDNLKFSSNKTYYEEVKNKYQQYDGTELKDIEGEISYKFTIDNEELDIENTYIYELYPEKKGFLPDITLGNGVALDFIMTRKKIILEEEK